MANMLPAAYGVRRNNFLSFAIHPATKVHPASSLYVVELSSDGLLHVRDKNFWPQTLETAALRPRKLFGKPKTLIRKKEKEAGRQAAPFLLIFLPSNF